MVASEQQVSPPTQHLQSLHTGHRTAPIFLLVLISCLQSWPVDPRSKVAFSLLLTEMKDELPPLRQSLFSNVPPFFNYIPNGRNGRFGSCNVL